MRLWFIPALIVAASTMSATDTCAMDVRLTYNKYPEDQSGFHPYGATGVRLTPTPPSGEWKLPEFTTDQPAYGLFTLAGKERLIAFDCSGGETRFYNRLYADADGDGDLTNDPVIGGELHSMSSNNYTGLFSAVDFTIDIDGVSLPYSIRVQIRGVNLTARAKSGGLTGGAVRSSSALLITNCAYNGELQLDGRTYRILLNDTDLNGIFTDKPAKREQTLSPVRAPLYMSADRLFINGGKYDSGNSDWTYLSDMLYIGGRLFEMKVDIPKGVMTLNEIRDGLADVRLGMPAERMSIVSGDYSRSVAVFDPGETVRLPAGDYRLMSYMACRKDDQGGLWKVCALATADSPVFSAGGQLVFGEPYIPNVEIPELARGGQARVLSRVSLSFNVSGANNEILTDLSRISGGGTNTAMSKRSPSRPLEPSYRVVKSDGEIVASGTFEYG